MKHVAIDLETMGVSPQAAIIAIGAVEFDVGYDEDAGHYFQLGREFYVNVDLQSSIDEGLKIDASTVMWWLTQSDKARASLIAEKPVLLGRALDELYRWWPTWTKPGEIHPTTDPRVCAWARGQDFDIGILRTAYGLYSLDTPWPYNKARDSRTFIEAVGFDVNTIPANQGAHNALADAKWEAMAIGAAMNYQSRRVMHATAHVLESLGGPSGKVDAFIQAPTDKRDTYADAAAAIFRNVPAERGPLECNCGVQAERNFHATTCPVFFVEPNSITG